MKKGFVLVLLTVSCILLSNTESVHGQEMTYYLEKYFDLVLTQKIEWTESEVSDIIILEDLSGMGIGYLIRINEGDTSNGYIIYLHDYGIVEMSFHGADGYNADTNQIYYILPGLFLDSETLSTLIDISGEGYSTTKGLNYKNYSSYRNEQTQHTHYQYDELIFDYELSTSNSINLSSNVNVVYTPGYVSNVIDNVPDYLNEAVDFGCAPTATGMMIAYYDNEYNDNITNLDSTSDFPQTANANTYNNSGLVAKNLITGLGSDMMTNIDLRLGTGIVRWSFGMEVFLSDYNNDSGNTIKLRHVLSPIYDDDPTTPNEIYEYHTLINKGNPVVLLLDDFYYGMKHAVIGIGYFDPDGPFTIPGPNGEVEGVIIYNDLTHGEKWIAYTAIEYMGYILIDDLDLEDIIENSTYTTHSLSELIYSDDFDGTLGD